VLFVACNSRHGSWREAGDSGDGSTSYCLNDGNEVVCLITGNDCNCNYVAASYHSRGLYHASGSSRHLVLKNHTLAKSHEITNYLFVNCVCAICLAMPKIVPILRCFISTVARFPLVPTTFFYRCFSKLFLVFENVFSKCFFGICKMFANVFFVAFFGVFAKCFCFCFYKMFYVRNCQ